jgi:hypothetical protein
MMLLVAYHTTPITLVLYALVFGVLMWGTYATLRAIIEGRWRLTTIVALLAVSLVVLFSLGIGVYTGPWETPDAVACADNAELIIEALPGPRGTPSKRVEGWDLGGCTVYWYAVKSAD